MCLAVPAQIVALDGDTATLDANGAIVTATVALIDEPNIGDWIILHTGVALSRIDPDAAEEMLRLLRDLPEAA